MKQIRLFEESIFENIDTTMTFEEHINDWMRNHTVHTVFPVGKGDGFLQICVVYEEE